MTYAPPATLVTHPWLTGFDFDGPTPVTVRQVRTLAYYDAKARAEKTAPALYFVETGARAWLLVGRRALDATKAGAMTPGARVILTPRETARGDRTLDITRDRSGSNAKSERLQPRPARQAPAAHAGTGSSTGGSTGGSDDSARK